MSQESFSDFKDSFSYGTRSDLNFKFLKGLSEEAAAGFFQSLLEAAAHGYDQADWSELINLVHEAQSASYAGPSSYEYDEGPFTPFEGELSSARIGLITSTGHFVEGEDPEPFGVVDMTQQEAMERINEFLREEPSMSAIPTDVEAKRLRVRHGGYDIQGGIEDRNVNLPIDRLREMESDGVIGELYPTAYSFVGACSQMRLTRQTGPGWIEMWRNARLDGAILVPV